MVEQALPIPSDALAREFLAVCFCAEWCGSCREYRPAFEALQEEFPNVGFIWVDIENNASWVGDVDIENFPTILIQRNEWVLFYGVMLPHQSHLRRMLEVFNAQSAEQSRDDAHASAEKRAWQEQHNFRAALNERMRNS